MLHKASHRRVYFSASCTDDLSVDELDIGKDRVVLYGDKKAYSSSAVDKLAYWFSERGWTVDVLVPFSDLRKSNGRFNAMVRSIEELQDIGLIGGVSVETDSSAILNYINYGWFNFRNLTIEAQLYKMLPSEFYRLFQNGIPVCFTSALPDYDKEMRYLLEGLFLDNDCMDYEVEYGKRGGRSTKKIVTFSSALRDSLDFIPDSQFFERCFC